MKIRFKYKRLQYMKIVLQKNRKFKITVPDLEEIIYKIARGEEEEAK
jgi:hypothetical protein